MEIIRCLPVKIRLFAMLMIQTIIVNAFDINEFLLSTLYNCRKSIYLAKTTTVFILLLYNIYFTQIFIRLL